MLSIKHFLIVSILALGLIGLTAPAQAETKIGYVRVEYVLGKMPDSKQLGESMQSARGQIQAGMQKKIEDYQNTLKDYQRNQLTMSETEKKEKKGDLEKMQQDIRRSELEAQASLQKKRAELMQPLLQKLDASIQKVAKANNFTHVVSDRVNGSSVLLFAEADYDLTGLVLEDLGIAPEE